MSYSDALDLKGNLVKQFDKTDRQKQAQLISRRWADSTVDLHAMIEDSRDGWDHYLHNRPQPSSLANTAKTAQFDKANKEASKQGLRFGGIPKAVDSIMSVLHNQTFPADERFFRGTPQNDVARKYQELYEQHRANNFAEDNASEKLRLFLLTMCIDPAAAVAVSWRKRTKRNVTYEVPKLVLGGIEIPLPVLGLKKKVDEDYVEWEGTCLEPLDFNDWRADTTARSMEESWFIRRWYEPCWKVEQDYDLKDVKPYHSVIEDIVSDPLGNQKREASGLTMPINKNDEDEGKQQALLMICYDDFVRDGKVYKNHCSLTLNGSEEIWFGPNPYDHGRIPYEVQSLLPIPNQIYGRSLITHVLPSAAAIDTLLDNILQISSTWAKPIFEVDVNEPVFRKSTKVVNGKTYPVKRVGNAIRQVPVNIVNVSALQTALDRLEEYIRDNTGANQAISGGEFTQPANTTAFQVEAHMQGSNSRFQSMINTYSTSLKNILQMSFSNDRQYKKKTEMVYIGEEEHELTPDLIRQMSFKWLIVAANANNTRGKQLSNYSALITQMLPPLIQAGLVKVSGEIPEFQLFEGLKQFLTLGGLNSFDQLFKKLPPPPPMGGMNGLPPVPPTEPGGAGQVPPAPGPQPPVSGPEAPPAGPPGY